MDDNNIPATKADIKMVMDAIRDLSDQNEKWMDEIATANEKWKDEIIRHFDIKVGQIRHDLMGANRDEISSLIDANEKHEQRLTRLEEHAGLVSMM